MVVKQSPCQEKAFFWSQACQLIKILTQLKKNVFLTAFSPNFYKMMQWIRIVQMILLFTLGILCTSMICAFAHETVSIL
jgi:hypothetical protein